MLQGFLILTGKINDSKIENIDFYSLVTDDIKEITEHFSNIISIINEKDLNNYLKEILENEKVILNNIEILANKNSHLYTIFNTALEEINYLKSS